MTREGCARALGERQDLSAHRGTHARHDGVCEQMNVLAALAQRRQQQWQHGDAEMEVLAKGAVFDHLAEVTVAGADEAHVGFFLFLAAEELEGLFLQQPQKLRLQGQRQVTDLVEKKGATAGKLDATTASFARAGVGAGLGAKELDLQQRVGNGRAIHGNERPAAALAVDVDRPREELFAGATFALQQHRCIGGSDLRRRRQRCRQRR